MKRKQKKMKQNAFKFQHHFLSGCVIKAKQLMANIV